MRALKNQTELHYIDNKILKGSLEHRFYIFLNDLYKDYTFSSLRKYFKKHSIGAFRTGILIELGFIEQIRFGQYIWIADKPLVKDAIKLTNTIRKNQKEYNKKYVDKKRNQKNEIEISIINKNGFVDKKEAAKLTGKTIRTILHHVGRYRDTEQINSIIKYINNKLYINKEFLYTLYDEPKKEVKKIEKIESKEKEIKNKHISLLWGMFKFEIKK